MPHSASATFTAQFPIAFRGREPLSPLAREAHAQNNTFFKETLDSFYERAEIGGSDFCYLIQGNEKVQIALGNDSQTALKTFIPLANGEVDSKDLIPLSQRDGKVFFTQGQVQRSFTSPQLASLFQSNPMGSCDSFSLFAGVNPGQNLQLVCQGIQALPNKNVDCTTPFDERTTRTLCQRTIDSRGQWRNFNVFREYCGAYPDKTPEYVINEAGEVFFTSSTPYLFNLGNLYYVFVDSLTSNPTLWKTTTTFKNFWQTDAPMAQALGEALENPSVWALYKGVVDFQSQLDAIIKHQVETYKPEIQPKVYVGIEKQVYGQFIQKLDAALQRAVGSQGLPPPLNYTILAYAMLVMAKTFGTVENGTPVEVENKIKALAAWGNFNNYWPFEMRPLPLRVVDQNDDVVLVSEDIYKVFKTAYLHGATANSFGTYRFQF